MLSILENAILAQGELGGFEVALDEPIFFGKVSPSPKRDIPLKSPVYPSSMSGKGTAHTQNAPFAPSRFNNEAPSLPAASAPKINMGTVTPAEKNEKWQSAVTLQEFYAEVEKHPIYQKYANSSPNDAALRSISKAHGSMENPPYQLVFRSPAEWTKETQNLLENLFTAISNRNASLFNPQNETQKINLANCAISFLAKIPIKRIMPRELTAMQKMLAKEISFINPQRIIFWGTAFRNQSSEIPFSEIAGAVKTFAGKPSIILYSPIEMLADENLKKETWKNHIPKSGWF